MIICETERLIIRHFNQGDSEYILEQLNDESFIRYIVDKQVRTLADAERYLVDGPLLSYKKNGYGLNMVLLKQGRIAMGMCGLVKREGLEHPDLGFAFLPEFWRHGYAAEASRAILEESYQAHGFKSVLGITLPDNQASNQLLLKLGFKQTGTFVIDGFENNLYTLMRSC